MDRITLGNTDLQISPLGLGTWQWGDRMVWQYGKGYGEEDVRALFQTSVEAGINFFDTAEVYGLGRSETLLGDLLPTSDQRLVTATKFFPFPWRLTVRSLQRALRRSLKRLQLEQVDLYYTHWPFPPVPVEVNASWLATAVEQGRARAVGVSNYNADQTRRAHAILAERGIPLACNQIPYSLLHRDPERNGLLDTCRQLGVTVIAYSPLAQGLLTGKYGPDQPPPGMRGRRDQPAYLQRLTPLIATLRRIGDELGGKTTAQVALNWCICKETVPIPGAKNVRQALDNGGALGWRLSAAQVAALDKASAELG